MNPSIAIIGTGFGGIAAAIELKRAGYDNLLLLEKADAIGGVWRDNSYPGAACDVPSPLYSYSYEPNPNWDRRYAAQPQVLAYLNAVADKYDIRRHVRFNSEVTSSSWRDTDLKWSVRLASGEELVTDILIPAVGQLSRPSLPAINGIGSFMGPGFHSASWDHTVDLRGLRVAVIGTGASAIQFVPAIQPDVGTMTVFQRTAPYILPRWDSTYGPHHHRLFHLLPLLQRGERLGWWTYLEAVTLSFVYAPPLAKLITALARRHMRKQTAAEPGLFEKVWPDYPMGCKRGLISDTYLPALVEPNVSLEAAPIQAVEPTGIRTSDGTLHPADVIIYGTGFAASDFLAPMMFTGRDRQPLTEAWAGGARAYFGLTVPGFPNMLIMYGPNTNTGGGSIVHFLETQARYVRAFVDHVAATSAAWEIKPEIEAGFDTETQSRLAGSVWARCSSWYRSDSGRITANWPGLSAEYRRRARFRPAEYQRAAARSPRLERAAH